MAPPKNRLIFENISFFHHLIKFRVLIQFTIVNIYWNQLNCWISYMFGEFFADIWLSLTIYIKLSNKLCSFHNLCFSSWISNNKKSPGFIFWIPNYYWEDLKHVTSWNYVKCKFLNLLLWYCLVFQGGGGWRDGEG